MKNIHYEAEHYFAAANTSNGFESRFDDIFNNSTCNRIYILKGGPGCGKSTFMKKAAEMCKNVGHNVVYFHCSSDPDSLDAILVKETKTAVIDGTSPHIFEPKLPGAFEITVDLGKAWDTDKLLSQKDKLWELSNRKKSFYSDAYDNLEAHKRILDILHLLCLPFYNKEKASKCAERLVKNLSGNKTTYRKSDFSYITNAFSCKGKVHLCCFEDMAKTSIFIKDVKDTALFSHDFLKDIYHFAKEKGTEVIVSLSPLDTSLIDGLFFVKEKVSVTLYNKELVDICDKNGKKCRIINAQRFFDTHALSLIKRERKFYSSLAASLEEKALVYLSNAGKTHFLLEDAYHPHTNYKKIEKITDEYCKKISVN